MSAPSPADTKAPPAGRTVTLGQVVPLKLDSGVELGPFTMAYQTYGTLNADRSNAILVCHALSGDQYLAGQHPVTGRRGWWDNIVGPGKPLDTNRFFLICSNILGGCMGTAGPVETNPSTGKAYGLSFPVITIGDMVKAQKLLIDHLGIDNLFCVVGGSMGGMQVLDWAVRYPDKCSRRCRSRPRCAARPRTLPSMKSDATAIMSDLDWCDGDYLAQGKRPERGLKVRA